jgi:hypothetical protein
MKSPAQPTGHPVGASIIELERRLDPMLRDRGPDNPFSQYLQATVREWSQAIWTASEALGASMPGSGDLERGLRLARRPVFVCGAARSGTTLLRDLLDGHPQLVVVPTESLFYTFLERALLGLRPDRHSSYLGCRWLERLVAPPPFWLLGASTPGESPYVDFARDFAGWWQIPEQHKSARIASWPMAAFAIAFAQRLGNGRLPPLARMWVEKTPGSERCLERIWRDFPAAKVIHIVRQPEAVLASIKSIAPERWNRRRTLAHVVGQMAPSYRIAAESDRRRPGDRYCLVRYEDLTANPDKVMARIAGFLGIEPLPSLLRPTVAGRSASNNTSFGSSRPDLHDVLDPIDRAMLSLAVTRQAAKLGYAPSMSSSSTRHSIVGGRAQRKAADALAAD